MSIPPVKKKPGRKFKGEMPVGESIYLIVPPEVVAIVNNIHHERNTRLSVTRNPALKTNKKAIYNELIRRGIEVLYGGIENIPVEGWDSFSYNYRKREDPDEIIFLGE